MNEPRKIDCPFLEGSYILLPEKWLGKHAARRDEAIEQCHNKKMGETLTRFAVAMVLLDDWNLPGLTGNPEQWDFERIDLTLIAWVTNAVLPDFFECLAFPATYSKPSGSGQVTAVPEMTTNPDGPSSGDA